MTDRPTRRPPTGSHSTRLRFGRFATLMLCALVLLGVAPASPQDGANAYLLRGRLHFDANDAFSILEEDLCTDVSGTWRWQPVPDPDVDLEWSVSKATVKAVDAATGGGDCRADTLDDRWGYTVPPRVGPINGGPYTPPFVSPPFPPGTLCTAAEEAAGECENGPVAYELAACRQGTGGIDDSTRYLLESEVVFDPRGGSIFDQNDIYRFATWPENPDARTDPLGAGCDDCCGGLPCLEDQDLTECAGALVIEYYDACDPDPDTVLCPARPGVRYPQEGTVHVKVPGYRPGDNAPQATSTVRRRQTRLPVQAGICTDADPCVPATPSASGGPCEIVADCRGRGGLCELDPSLVTMPGCALGATQQRAEEVDVIIGWGDSDANLNDGWKITDVPIACNAVTRVRLMSPCPTGAHAWMEGKWQVLGYESEVRYCEDNCHEGLGTFPRVGVKEGPSRNDAFTQIADAPVPVCGSRFQTQEFTIVDIGRSDRGTAEEDRNYSVTSQYLMVSDEPDPHQRFVNFVASTSATNGPFDPDDTTSGAAFLQRNSTPYALFRDCAQPAPDLGPGFPSNGLCKNDDLSPSREAWDRDGDTVIDDYDYWSAYGLDREPFQVFPDHRFEDWLWLCRQQEITGIDEPDYLRRCESFPQGDQAVCPSVVTPDPDYPCTDSPFEGDEWAYRELDTVARDPLVMAPGEIQGCLVLRDNGLPGIAEALEHEIPISTFRDGRILDDPANCCARFELTRTSYVEALGWEYASSDGTGLDDMSVCEGPPEGACPNRTSIYRSWDTGRIFSNLVADEMGLCPAASPDDRRLRFRLVPGQVGNLSTGYAWNRFKLNFRGDEADDACGPPVRGSFWVNHGTPDRDEAGDEEGNLQVAHIHPQEEPGNPDVLGGPDNDPRNPLLRTQDLCLGRADVYFFSDSPFQICGESSCTDGIDNDADGERDEPAHQMVFGENLDVSCEDPKIRFEDRDLGVGFRGRVIGDGRTVRVPLPLPEGTYRVRPAVTFADQLGLTTFPESCAFDVTCGERTCLCLTEAGCTTEDTPPQCRIDPGDVVFPGAGGPVFGAEDECRAPVDVSAHLFDCDQAAAEGRADFWVTVLSNDVDEGGCSPGTVPEDPARRVPGFEDRGRVAEDRDGVFLRDHLVAGLDQSESGCTSCGFGERIFKLWAGDGPEDGLCEGTTFTFLVWDEPPADRKVEDAPSVCTVLAPARDGEPPTVVCDEDILTETCTPGPTVPAEPCIAGAEDTCDRCADAAWEAREFFPPNELLFSGEGTCAGADYPVGITQIDWNATDRCGNRSEESCREFLLVHSRPVADYRAVDASGVPLPGDAACQAGHGEETRVRLDASYSLGDTPPHDDQNSDRLVYSWSPVPGACPEEVLLVDDDLDGDGDPSDDPIATLVFPAPAPSCPEVPITCEVELVVREEGVQEPIDCQDKVVRTVTLNPAPVARLQEVFTSCPEDTDGDGRVEMLWVGDGVGCGGAEITGFLWTHDCPGELNDPSSQTPTLHVDPAELPAACTATLTVRDSNGCEDTRSVPVFLDAEPLADPGGAYATCMDSGSDDGTTRVPLDGSGSTARGTGDCRLLDHAWSTDCPDAVLLDTGDPARPVLQVPNAAGSLSCQVCLVVTQGCDHTGNNQEDAFCTAEECTTVDLWAPPHADAGGPYASCLDRESAGDPVLVPVDGTGAASPGCVLTDHVWDTTCPGGRLLADPAAPGDASRRLLEVPAAASPVDCQVCLTVVQVCDSDGDTLPDATCASDRDCGDVRLCPDPLADFDTHLTMDLSGCPPADLPVDVTFTSHSSAGGCGELIREDWSFCDPADPLCPRDAMPPVAHFVPPDIPSTVRVGYDRPGTKRPSLTVTERDPVTGLECSDTEASCGICVPSSVEFKDKGQALVRLDLNCNHRDICAQELEMTVYYHGVGACEGCECNEDGLFDVDPATRARLSFGSPLQTVESVRFEQTRETICGSGDGRCGPGRLALRFYFSAGCIIQALQDIGEGECPRGNGQGIFLDSLHVQIETGLECDGCLQDLDVDHRIEDLPDSLEVFQVKCNSGDCLRDTVCACP